MAVTASQPAPHASPDIPRTGPTLRRRLLRNRLVQVGAALVALLTLLAVAAPLLAPYRMEQQFPDGLNDDGMPVGPCARFPLGTDGLGRDVLSRLLYGARISLTVGVVAMLTAVVLGTLVGLCAGYFGAWIGMLLMRFTDIMMAVPPLLLALTLAGLLQEKREIPWLGLTLERGLTSVFLVIGIVSWTGIARVVRAQVLSVKEREFIQAAQVIGCSHSRILFRHILPNVLPTVVVLGTLSVAGTIGLEAGLSYLGVGVPPPAPSWGTMISDGQSYFTVAPWLVLPPGIAIILAILGFNLLGQGLQDVLDPYHTGKS
jgi:peptide/nickel transport system permease protein